MIFRTSQMNENVFLSLSDEIKIKMHTQQFYIPPEKWDEINDWVIENIFGSYYIETEEEEKGENKKNNNRWILIYEETDVMAFKLRWV